MHFHFSFYSSILLIFFSQGMVFCLLLLRRGLVSYNASSLWLSLFIFLCSLYISLWMLGHAGWYSLQPYRDVLFYLPLQQQLLIGPVLFFYTQSLLNGSFRVTKITSLHFLPAALYGLYSLVVFIMDKLVWRQYVFYADGRDKDLEPWYQLAGVASMLLYLVLSLRYYRVYKRVIYQATSFAGQLLFSWMRTYLLLFFCMQLALLALAVFYPDWGSFTQKWWYYALFACLYYYVALTAYANPLKSVVAFRSSGLPKAPVYLILPSSVVTNEPTPAAQEQLLLSYETPADEVMEASDLEPWKMAVTRLMEEQRLYEDPSLTLAAVAEKAGTNVAVLSRTINRSFGLNFNDYVNRQRIEAIQRLFLKGEHRRQTLLSIAFECGFNSKTTFNRAFKKHEGQSPSQWLLKNGGETGAKS